MKARYVLFGLALLAAAAYAAKRPAQNDLVIHEWGTFLAMNGSDGVTLDGMYHEEHALPAFVHARSREQLHLHASDLKGETPVIYFYTGQPRQARVIVRFPQGVWTQWYPQAMMEGPPMEQMGAPLKPEHGRIHWFVDIIPPDTIKGMKSAPSLPQTESDALWNYARKVDAAYVRTHDFTKGSDRSEYERFLFYRGLGRAALPVGFTMAAGGTLTMSAEHAETVRHLFVLRVENGRAAYRYFPALAPGRSVSDVIPSMAAAQPVSAFCERIGDDLAGRLVESGLYPKEARAMVNTWRTSYFQSDGIRALFVLPQSWTDRFIPMQVYPAPREIVRVMVGRVELLSPERESRAEQAIRDLASADAAARERAFEYIRSQGRYVEPVLRRTLNTTRDEKTRLLCKRMLLTDFVNELRSSVNAATNGAKVTEQPEHVRALLASVLREVGLYEQAREEGRAAAAYLKKSGCPPIDESEARHYLRAYSRAMEGIGDDRQAAEGYGAFLAFASQVKGGCAGCHSGVSAPRTMDWFHGWYAGRKYAQCVARTGQTDSAIAQNTAALQDPKKADAAQLRLAFLYESKGAKAQADAVWAMLEGKPEKAAHVSGR